MPRILDGIKRRLAERSDERLEEEIAALRIESAQIARDRGRSREVASKAVDQSIDRGLAWLDRQLERSAVLQRPLEAQPTAQGLPPLVLQWSGAAGGPDALRERWKAAVDRAGNLCDTPLVDLERRSDEIQARVHEIRVEQERRQLAAEMAELEARERTLEERVTA